MLVDPKRILERAEHYKPEISRFLREMIAIPSESGQEKEVCALIKREMEAVGFDRVEIDPMGNVLGFIGNGPRLIALDAHVDTVGVGDRSQWKFDPFAGREDEETIGGRGASDQEGGMASMVYAGKIIKELGLLPPDVTLLMAGTVMEEDCDGLCWLYIVNEDNLRPEFVVSTEPTSCNIYRGQRGRMEIRVNVKGVSCHGSAPERGDNAIYKMGPILSELKALHANLRTDPFLGKGSLTVSEIGHCSPSRCAVADGCWISVDRRLTWRETWEEALEQISNLPAVQAAQAEVTMYNYDKPAYTGLVYSTECFFPAWVLEESHPVCEALVLSYTRLFDQKPLVDKWTFSTNGVSIMGRMGIPCIGFGPGHEDQAHAPNETTWKDELVRAAAMYAMIPAAYVELT